MSIVLPIINSILGAAKNNENAQQAATITSAVNGVMNSAGKAKTMTDLSGKE